VIDLDFDLVTSLLPKLGSFFYGKPSNSLSDTLNLRVASKKVGISENNLTYFFCLIRVCLILARLSTSAEGLCLVGIVSSKYSRSYCN
jgi:hypothetical protein